MSGHSVRTQRPLQSPTQASAAQLSQFTPSNQQRPKHPAAKPLGEAAANDVPVDSSLTRERSAGDERSDGPNDPGGNRCSVSGAVDDGTGADAHLFRDDVLPLRVSGDLHRAV